VSTSGFLQAFGGSVKKLIKVSPNTKSDGVVSGDQYCELY